MSKPKKIDYSETDITIEDVRKWEAELDMQRVKCREYKVYIITTKEKFNKIWRDALLKSAGIELPL